MPAFPTLSVKPIFPVGEVPEDPTVRSVFEGGYQHTRPRHTRNRRKFQLQYHNLPETDKSGANKLDAFIVTVKSGADSFTWTHPDTGTSYTVRFFQTPVYQNIHKDKYDCDFILMEV